MRKTSITFIPQHLSTLLALATFDVFHFFRAASQLVTFLLETTENDGIKDVIKIV